MWSQKWKVQYWKKRQDGAKVQGKHGIVRSFVLSLEGTLSLREYSHEQRPESSLARVYAQSYPTLSNPMDCSPLGSSVHSIFLEEYCSGLPFPPREGLPHPGIQPVSPVSLALTGRFPTTEPHRKPFTSPQTANPRVNLTSSRRESSHSEWGK